nr:unnamed protein product [Spirometra erinaceieuropaei]
MRVRARDKSGGHASDSGSRRQVRSASRAHKNAQSKTRGRSRTPGSHQRGKSPSSNSSSKKDKERGHKSRRPPLLKTEMVVKKTGGTMLTINGAKVDFAKNAFGGKKDKFVFAPVPSPVRGYSSPWLGPNLRLASEIQMIWAPSKLKTPCSVFLPFTFASALELTTEEATERAKTLIAAAAAAAAAAAKAAKEAAAAAAEAGAEGTKRQIVWRVADGDPNSDTEKVRRKAQKTGPYRDAHQSSTMRAENLRVKSGWLNLMLGVKGGSWKPIPITGPFTPRTLNITTYQLGRFVFLYNNDPFRTPASKLAHLMGRLEALCVAPPGVLLICLQVTPLKWNLWISVVPSSKLIDALEERLKEGYVPLVQHNASLMRKAYAVANCAVQSMPALVPPPAEDEDPITIPVFGNTKYRLTGYDLLHVLLYNGLCVKVRILGRTQFKVAGTFDVFSNVLESRRRETKMSYSDRSLSATVSDVDPADFDLSVGTAKKQPKEPVYVPPPIAKPEAYITRLETRLFYNELLSESGTIIELEPAKDWTSESHRTQMTRDKLVRLLMDRRLEQLDKEPPPEDTAPAANQTTANNDVMMHNNVPTDESMELRDLLKTETLKDNLSERDDNGILFSELMRRGNNVSPAVSLMDTDNEEDALGVESKWQQVNRSNVSVRNSERTSEMTEPTSSLTVELFPGYDGDDGVTRQHFTDLKEAFSAKNSPTLSFEIVKDMARRFCNICDKGKTESASEFVKSMFEICNVGRIELYLIQPQELAQVRERQKEEVNINDILGSNVNAEVITNGEEPDDQGFVEGHNTMKWKNTKPEADEDDEDKPKPLAAFDILIDPAIFAMNVKSKSKKGKN